MAISQAFAPLLIKAYGCIVNNTSANAIAPLAFMSKHPVILQLLADDPGVYIGFRAALASADETWRFELQPPGVRTITLITLGVKTTSPPKDHHIEMPETSAYCEIRDFIHGLTDRFEATGISTRQSAIKMIREVEKGTVGTVWAS